MTDLENAYELYREVGFTMAPTVRHKKFNATTGAYSERANIAFSSKETGYLGIIPPNIIIVDNDKYEDDNEFERLLKDLNLGYTPEPFALTPSGGEHYAFENPHTDLVIGNHGYAKVDIYAGYQSVIPIVGTEVKNKQNKLNMYTWADELGLDFTVNPFSTSMLEVLKMRERGENTSVDYDEDGLGVGIKADDMPEAEVLELCALVPIEGYGYDTGWLKFAMAIYDRYEGSAEGLAIFQATCSRADHNDVAFNIKKWNNGNFKPTGRITYKTLRSLANEGRIHTFRQSIATCGTVKGIQELAEELKTQNLNTSTDLDTIVRDGLVNTLSERCIELTGKPEKVLCKNAMKAEPIVGPIETPEGFDVYRMSNKYVIRHHDKVIVDVGSQMLKEQLTSLGIVFGKDELAVFRGTIQTIASYEQIPDYTLSTRTKFETIEGKGSLMPKFIEKFNPLYKIEQGVIDPECVDDFFNKIWNGKLLDIVRIVALTIKLGEQKLNRLMVVAPSNAGKSEIFTMMNFQKITMSRLLNGMRGDKGVGHGVIEGIKQSGLLLIDEANKSLEAEIKDMDKEVHIDQFGSGGTQILPLHFTALTSTHSNATRNNSDELYNRFLQVELTKKEMHHTIMESPLFLADSDKYTESITGELLKQFKEVMTNDEGVVELRELQAQYRLPLNNDLDELLYEIGEDFMSDTKSSARESGDVIEHAGHFHYKRKSDVTRYFENRLGEIESLDVGKYAELLTKHFVYEKSKSIKVGGKPLKYYKVDMKPYTEDLDTLITNQFDDLDNEF